MISDAMDSYPNSLPRAAAWLAALGEQPPKPSHLGRSELFEPAAGPSHRGLHLLAAPADWSPAVTRSDRCHVIFDGILYNRAELAGRFADRFLRDPSDADLVEQAYRCWGADAIAHLRGAFALVIEDGARDLVLCARDPLGVQPLFYSEVGRTLLLSPAIETLLAHPEVPAEINRALLVAYLTRCWPVNDETYFTRVRRVPPGYLMRIDASGRKLNRYWDPVSHGRPVVWTPDNQASERFEVLLEQAVSRCMASEPAGIYLSGGLDSSTVAMVASDLSRHGGQARPTALSLAFPGLACDDSAVQRGVANDLGLPQVRLPFDEAAGPEGTIAAALAMTRTLPAPLSLIWRPALRRLALHGRQLGCRVILSGDGADDWLLENAFMAVDFLRSLDFVGLFRLCQIYSRSYHFTRLEAVRMLLWRYAARSLLRDAWRAAADRAGASRLVPDRWRFPVTMSSVPQPWVAPDPALRADVAQRVEERFASRRGSPRIDSYYFGDTRSWLDAPDRWFGQEESFLVGRSSGVPVRMPFRDPDLIDFLVTIRPLGRSEDGLSKAFLRRRLVRRFPRLGFDQQRKTNLGEAFLDVVARQAGSQFQALGGLQTLADMGVVDARRAGDLLGDTLAGRGPRSHAGLAWIILNLETWVRAHT